jgi:hypothetical protein
MKRKIKRKKCMLPIAHPYFTGVFCKRVGHIWFS